MWMQLGRGCQRLLQEGDLMRHKCCLEAEGADELGYAETQHEKATVDWGR